MTPLEEFSTDSKDYLTRSMRILESCTSTWPVPDMQARIDALREAFSADISRPFELKPSFPYGSPSSSVGLQPSPPPDDHLSRPMPPHHDSLRQSHQLPYNAQPVTPPVSAGFDTSKGNSFSSVSMPMMSNGQQQQQQPLQPTSIINNQVEWNPTPIFKYVPLPSIMSLIVLTTGSSWNTAFGTPTAPMASKTMLVPQQPSPDLYPPSSLPTHPIPPLQSQQSYPEQTYPVSSETPSLSRVQTAPQLPAFPSPTPSFVTSSMWRDTVASTYDPRALKRGWDTDHSFFDDQVQVKRPR